MVRFLSSMPDPPAGKFRSFLFLSLVMGSLFLSPPAQAQNWKNRHFNYWLHRNQVTAGYQSSAAYANGSASGVMNRINQMAGSGAISPHVANNLARRYYTLQQQEAECRATGQYFDPQAYQNLHAVMDNYLLPH